MIPDIIGFIGFIFIITTYLLLVNNKVESGKIFYLFNLIGSLMILTSLVFKPNIGAIAIESAWALISLYGLIKSLSRPPDTWINNKNGKKYVVKNTILDCTNEREGEKLVIYCLHGDNSEEYAREASEFYNKFTKGETT